VQKSYIVEGRQFRTQTDYNLALKDKQTIDALRKKYSLQNPVQLQQLNKKIQNRDFHFYTLLGTDFKEEVEEALKKTSGNSSLKDKQGSVKSVRNAASKKQKKKIAETVKTEDGSQKEIDTYVQAELKKQERRRRIIVTVCSLLAVCSLGYFSVYSYYDYRTQKNIEAQNKLREQSGQEQFVDKQTNSYSINYDAEKVVPDVLDEYKILYNKNKKLIGWLEIDDTNINYPVMQTINNEYYLDHNLNQEYDKNGSIFMDKDCDILKPSTNFILYGHNMKNGKMFGKLSLYSSEDYYKNHKYIQFDTIYEKGTYEIMYVFRSQIYTEEEIVFKYYQFIDVLSEQEFDSYIQAMAELSLYDTGVEAQFGDQLLTLSTCDYYVDDGRFVVVAKKIMEP